VGGRSLNQDEWRRQGVAVVSDRQGFESAFI